MHAVFEHKEKVTTGSLQVSSVPLAAAATPALAPRALRSSVTQRLLRTVPQRAVHVDVSGSVERSQLVLVGPAGFDTGDTHARAA